MIKHPPATLVPPHLQIALALIVTLSACTVTPARQQGVNSSNGAHCPTPVKAPACPTIAEVAACPTVQQRACPNNKPQRCPVHPATKIADKLVIGEVESVNIKPPGQSFMARIDTGAAGTSIHANDIAAFERDGREWVRFEIDHPSMESPMSIERPLARTVLIKQAGTETRERRLVVKMTVSLGSISEQIDVSLSERTTMTYPVLIGRNFLRNLAIVDVSQRLIAQ